MARTLTRTPPVRFFVHDPETGDTDQITAKLADRHWRNTDAGVTYEPFVVRAPTLAEADALASEWIALWRADDNGDVGDMMLLHREYRPGRTYAVLTRVDWQ